MASQVIQVAQVAQVTPATAATHPFTHAIQFTGQDIPGLLTIEGFRTLLENTYTLRLSPQKKNCYVRNRAWLQAIHDCSQQRPVGYVGNAASWKNEIGFTNPDSSKWRRQNGLVYSKTGKNTSAPHTATEDIYQLMTNLHQQFGHKGRDNFYNLVKVYSASITKDFCNSYINVCCQKASCYTGDVILGWLPTAETKAVSAAPASTNRHGVVDNAAPIDFQGALDPRLAAALMAAPMAAPMVAPMVAPLQQGFRDSANPPNGQQNAMAMPAQPEHDIYGWAKDTGFVAFLEAEIAGHSPMYEVYM